MSTPRAITRPLAGLRWIWGQLTSMRTALVLLLLIALAAIPGSMIPQRNISPIEVAIYQREHPGWNTILEPLGMYQVYTSAWFSAIYLLLFISLIGCIVPRIGRYARSLGKPPPKLASRPENLPESRIVELTGEADAALDRAQAWLRRKHYRIRRSAEGISAERGYLREVGNLIFHTSLIGVLLGLAWTNLLGYLGSAAIVEGKSFSNVLTQYDEFSAGGWYNTDSLEPFSLKLNQFRAAFETGPTQRGAARLFEADVELTQAGSSKAVQLEVNKPLTLPGGSQVTLLGHGYAPHVSVTDGNGDLAFSGPVVFLPQDGNFASVGVIKVPDARPNRLAFEGFFFPTAVLDQQGPRSVFPDALNPELYLNIWFGPPGKETGIPENIYVLNPAGLTPVAGDGNDRLRLRLQPGTGVELPNSLGSIRFDGWSRWVKIQVSQTPGNPLTLGSVLVAIAGLCLSLFVRPRRIFIRLRGEQFAVGGLDRSGAATGLAEQLTEISGLLGRVSQEPQEPKIQEKEVTDERS